MNDNFVKIEDKKMPNDRFKFFDRKDNLNGGFTDLIFLVGSMITAFMWGILMILGK